MRVQSVVSLPQNGTLRNVVDTFLKHHLDSLRHYRRRSERVVGLITSDHLIGSFSAALPRTPARRFPRSKTKARIASLFNVSSIGLWPLG